MSGPTAPATPYTFVSYASADRERVLPLVDALQRAGVPVWLDREGIHGGANYGREIAAAIKDSAALLLMTSPLSLASRNVRQEIALAWEYERPYVPLLLEPVTIPEDVKYWLTAAQWVEVLDRPEADWLPQVLTALAPLGIAPPAPAPAPQEHLAGREREQAILRERLDAALGGSGGLVLVGGEAGVGKTTLVEAALAEAAARGALTLVGHCYDLAETPPYGPWVELFGRYRPGPAAPPRPPAFARRGSVGAVASRAALVAEVRDWLAALAVVRPVALLLDDLHWADPASLDLLRAVARDLADLPVLLVATYRDDELTRRHPLYALLPVLEREARAQRLDLRRFEAGGLRALVAARYGLDGDDASRLVTWLVERAEGNAFFTVQLLRALVDDGVLGESGNRWVLGDLGAVGLPAPLRQVLDARLARLGEEHLHLLTLAAVIGHEVPLVLWATVAETDEDGLLGTIEAALQARLLAESPDGTTMRFAHALIREALYAGLVALRRRRVHRRIGEVLAAASSPDPDAVAYHLQRAGDAGAAEWLIRAGERAQKAYAWLTAADRYEAALALLEAQGTDTGRRVELLITLAQLRRYGDTRQSIALEEAARLAEALGDAAQAASARFEAGHIRCIAGMDPAGLAAMAAELPALEALPPGERARLPALRILGIGPEEPYHRGALVQWTADFGRYTEAWDLAAPFVSGALGATARGLAGLVRIHAMRGRAEAARRALVEQRALYRASGQYIQLGGTFKGELIYVTLPYATDRVAERRRVADEGEIVAARVSTAATFGPNQLSMELLLLEGEWDKARTAAQAGREGLYVVARMECASVLARIAFYRGDATQARSAVRELFPAGPATEPGAVYFPAALQTFTVAIDLALDAGDLAGALAWLRCNARWLAWADVLLGQAEAHLSWAAYHRAAADPIAARARAEQALALATEPRQPLALLAAHRLLGELDTAEGRHAEAQAHLAEALTLAGACEAPYERALTLLALAELHLATGDRSQATSTLAEARALLEPLGARPALGRADALVARLEAMP